MFPPSSRNCTNLCGERSSANAEKHGKKISVRVCADTKHWGSQTDILWWVRRGSDVEMRSHRVHKAEEWTLWQAERKFHDRELWYVRREERHEWKLVSKKKGGVRTLNWRPESGVVSLIERIFNDDEDVVSRDQEEVEVGESEEEKEECRGGHEDKSQGASGWLVVGVDVNDEWSSAGIGRGSWIKTAREHSTRVTSKRLYCRNHGHDRSMTVDHSGTVAKGEARGKRGPGRPRLRLRSQI